MTLLASLFGHSILPWEPAMMPSALLPSRAQTTRIVHCRLSRAAKGYALESTVEFPVASRLDCACRCRRALSILLLRVRGMLSRSTNFRGRDSRATVSFDANR